MMCPTPFCNRPWAPRRGIRPHRDRLPTADRPRPYRPRPYADLPSPILEDVPVDAVLFDLDGTLVDSGAGIARAAARALAAAGRPPLTPDQLREFVGPPLRDAFAALGADGAALDALVDGYRRHYLADGILDFTVVDGVPDLLDALATAGIRLAVATSKRTESARRVLTHAGLAERFAAVEGSEPDDSRPTKAEVMAAALAALGTDRPGRVVMVGDREHDVRGARDLSTDFIGATWGYGSVAELRGAGALRLAGSPAVLADLVLGGGSGTSPGGAGTTVH